MKLSAIIIGVTVAYLAAVRVILGFISLLEDCDVDID